MMERSRREMSRGRWAVERERGQIPDWRPPASGETASIDKVLPGVLKKMGLSDRVWEQDLLRDWPGIVGEAVARHARPGRVQGRVLCVYVSNSAWLNELRRYSEKRILENIRARYGNRIHSLRIQLDPDAGRV